MKRLQTAAVLCTVLILGSVWSVRAVDNTAQAVAFDVENDRLNEARETWDAAQTLLGALLLHSEIDQADRLFDRVLAAQQNGLTDEFSPSALPKFHGNTSSITAKLRLVRTQNLLANRSCSIMRYSLNGIHAPARTDRPDHKRRNSERPASAGGYRTDSCRAGRHAHARWRYPPYRSRGTCRTP